MPCRVNKRRQWTARICLESQVHATSIFVTLTYSDECRPGQLAPADLRNFLKRLRHLVPPFRYFAVGEYGERSGREHYHAMLFGLAPDHACAIEKAWAVRGNPIGLIHVGTCTRESAQYVAGYTTKKMTRAGDPRLGGRYPEFARMSLRPGIGADAVAVLAAQFLRDAPESVEVNRGLSSVVIDGKTLPCGQYLTRVSREVLGLDVRCSDEAWYEASERFQEIVLADPAWRTKGIRQTIIDAGEQARRNLAALQSIFSKVEVI